MTVARVPAQGLALINKIDGLWGHLEGASGAFQLVVDQLKGIEVLKLSFIPAKFHGGGESKQECYPYPEAMGMEAGRAAE